MRNFLIIYIISLSFLACEKPEGEGGNSVIEGQVYEIFTWQNDSTGLIDTLYFKLEDAGKDVFIIYGDDKSKIYDDKFEIDYNGRYHFEYLRKGNYTVYLYADSTDNSNVKYEFPIFKSITISSNKSYNLVDDFVIEKNQ